MLPFLFFGGLLLLFAAITRRVYPVISYLQPANLPLDAGDALWLARSVLGEAGADAARSKEGLAVISTILRRYSMMHKNPSFDSLTSFLQWFSSPVRAPGTPGGDAFTKEHPAEAARSHSRHIYNLSADEIPAEIWTLVNDVFAGRVELLPQMGNFASYTLYQAYGADVTNEGTREATMPGAVRAKGDGTYVPVAGTSPRSNVFSAMGQALAYPRVYVAPVASSAA